MNALINKGESIFIAGGHGMVGSAIFRNLLNSGYGRKEHGGKILRPSRKDLDLTNYESLNKWFIKNKPTVVIISAAKVGGIYANKQFPYDFLLDNLKIETNLMELSMIHNVKRLLFLGSSCIYPKYSKQPITEDELLTSPLEETNQFYAIAKIAGLKLCEAMRSQHNFDAICLMPTNLYGPRDNYHPTNSHVIPSLIRKFQDAKDNDINSVICWGSGNPLREFLHVDDLAEACTFVLEKWDPRNIVDGSSVLNNQLCWLNVGSENEISIKDLAKLISNSVGYKGKIIWDGSKPDGTPRKKLETSRLYNLGWLPKIDLERGIKATIEDYKKERIRKDNRL
jgi:GDP-L-fucose synthase